MSETEMQWNKLKIKNKQPKFTLNIDQSGWVGGQIADVTEREWL